MDGVSSEGSGYVTPVPPRRPGGSGRVRWLGVLAGFAVLVGIVVLQRHSGNAPAARQATTSSASIASTTAPASSAPATTDPSAPETGGTGFEAPTITLPITPSSLPWNSSPGSPTGTTTSEQPSKPSPVTTLATPAGAAIPHEKGWEIVGYGVAGVVRVDPATGRVVLVPGPNAIPANPVQAIVSVAGHTLVTGYGSPALLFPDAGPVALAPGDLADPQFVAEGPDPGHLWITGTALPGPDGTAPTVRLVDWDGRTSSQLTLPPYVSPYGGGMSDGAGYVLASGIGGTYDIRPGQVRLITHGEVIAVGPTGYLVYECGDTPTCQAVLVDRATGNRRVVTGLRPARPLDVVSAGIVTGRIAADGRHAAYESFSRAFSSTSSSPVSPELHLVDLPSGRDRTLDLPMSSDGGTVAAFSPDGRYLVAATLTKRVALVDTTTGKVLTLPPSLPAVSLVTVRTTTG
jgi:hypothetical protein